MPWYGPAGGRRKVELDAVGEWARAKWAGEISERTGAGELLLVGGAGEVRRCLQCLQKEMDLNDQFKSETDSFDEGLEVWACVRSCV